MKSHAFFLLFLVSGVVVLAVSIVAVMLMVSSANTITYNSKKRLIALSQVVARMTTAEELDGFRTAGDMDKPEYIELRKKLHEFAEESGLDYAYYMRLDSNNMMQFIVDNVYGEDEQDGLQSEPTPREEVPDKALAGLSACTELSKYSEGWYGYLTAYSPVFDSDGNVVAIAGADLFDQDILNAHNDLFMLAIILITAMILVLGSSFLCMVLYRKKATQSETANIAKSNFLSRMSHEIRTPMNAIIGLCRMANASEDIPEIRGHLKNISVSSNHLLKLINDILDLSKIESGKIKLEEIPMPLLDEIDNIYKIVGPQMEAKGLYFSKSVDGDIPPYVFCDPTHIKQIVVNLLSNALKFTPQGGKVFLGVKLLEQKEDKCNIEWRVRDSGIGIEEKYLAHLFDPFEQGDGGTTRKYGGTGLGLAISKQLVEMMGGSIDVKSIVGKGSEFTFNIWVRIADKSDVNTTAGEDKDIDVDLTGKRILLVEDAELNRLIAENVFTAMGAEVDFAENGLEGFKKFRQQRGEYDLVFMDIQMPVMDGYEATRKIRESSIPNAGSVPIIAMTANVFKEDIEKAMDAGMDAHVGKPFEIEQVKQAIADSMKRDRLNS